MAKGRLLPVIGIVALRALAAEVIGWPGVAGLAVVQTVMAERHLSPVIGIVTLGALTGEVVGW